MNWFEDMRPIDSKTRRLRPGESPGTLRPGCQLWTMIVRAFGSMGITMTWFSVRRTESSNFRSVPGAWLGIDAHLQSVRKGERLFHGGHEGDLERAQFILFD